MSHISRDLFKAIHEGKWLSIEYQNQKKELTRYWIAVQSIDPRRRTIQASGFHVYQHTVMRLDYIRIDAIVSSSVIEGSWCEINQELVEAIDRYPERYETIFGTTANLKVLNYLVDCSRLDTEPYQTDYTLVKHLDGDSLEDGEYYLNSVQFGEIVRRFQEEAGQDLRKNFRLKQLCLNVMSIVIPGKSKNKERLYVLAYRRLFLDVEKRVLKPAEDLTICREFTVDGERQSIRRFLSEEDLWLLDDLEAHMEEVKNRITEQNRRVKGVDDRPYVIALASDPKVDLEREYEAVTKMFETGEVTDPVKAFFGKVVSHNRRRKDYPIILLKKQANLDQLLAIHSAMKYPVAYIQGPPGTGKSYTIVNTIITAFFNDHTVLLASYNNHPINSVVKSLQSIRYQGQTRIPFPILRLGNSRMVDETLDYIKITYERIRNVKVYEKTLEKNHEERMQSMKQLSLLLERHEKRLHLQWQKDALECMVKSNHHLTFQTDLEGRQLPGIRSELEKVGEVDDEQALALLQDDQQKLLTYLYYTSIRFWKRLGEPKYEELRNILEIQDRDDRRKCFDDYLLRPGNMKSFLRIFPVIATTCLSAYKLGGPETHFDMVIMDEASQCNMAVSLVPILRGRKLMLVGDPQQLNPVILLEPRDNEILKQRYLIPEEYDYIKNSIYKAFLANDAVSDELLLRHHYRCSRKIIEFNNKKYYNNRLCIDSQVKSDTPLTFVDVPDSRADERNTAPREAQEIVKFVRDHPDRSIGIITPFANQKEYIEELLKNNRLDRVSCGTVHAFQGDEKDIILFSTALTDQTSDRTYGWLKNNRELINVATSRAREQLVMFSSLKNLRRLHQKEGPDDMYELAEYVRSNGNCQVSADPVQSRALGIKPYSTKTEADFLDSLNHALDNVLNTQKRCTVKKEVAIAQVFRENIAKSYLFYSGRFDFVICEKERGGGEYPILAIELDGKEHSTDAAVRERDEEKKRICQAHGFELIRVENSYARRYYYIKRILEDYFKNMR